MQIIRTEQQIMSTWVGDIAKPVVSICCIAFNHESYIKDCLNGFLEQVTDFPFEIIVHDDASSDSTREIIKEYASKFPLIVKPIFQVNNQYTLNMHLPFSNCWKNAVGEYIALCEGDDYWNNPFKLALQVEALSKSHCDICFTNANIEFLDRMKKSCLFFKNAKKRKVLGVSSIILAGGMSMPTASILVKSIILKELLPEWFFNAPVGDFYIQFLGSQRNGALYLPDITCSYRMGVPGSWTEKSRLDVSKSKTFFKINSFLFVMAARYKSFYFYFYLRALRNKLAFAIKKTWSIF